MRALKGHARTTSLYCVVWVQNECSSERYLATQPAFLAMAKLWIMVAN